MGYNLNLGAWNKVFAVPSCVVERYVKLASGSSIKVLLYFLCNAGQTLTAEDIFKATGVKTEDCEDALQFWCETGILCMNESTITPAVDLNISQENTLQKPTSHGISDVSLKKIMLERSPEFYPKDIVASIRENTELDYLFEHCEKLYGRPLKHTERNTLMILTEEIGIPVDCALMLVDYCHSVNKATPAYIKTIASDWVERDIMTIDKAEAEIRRLSICTECENELKKLFEMNSAFSKNQKEQIYKWTVEYAFSSEMIEEAYQRTLDGASKLSFPYMNKILETWHNKNIKNKADLIKSENKQKTEKKDSSQPSFDIDEITRASMEKYG